MHDEMMNKPEDHEAKMARADLFKLAQYSFKLFKMIREDQELEGWVQAKITKSADYIASVYHYLEYEMKISEYGDHIENAEMYSESIRRVFAQKLDEAKQRASAIKEEMKVGDTKKTATGELTKTKTGVVHKRTDFSDEEHGEAPSKVKQKSAAEKKAEKSKDIKLPKHSGNTWGMKGGEKFGKKMEGMAPSDPDGATAPPPKGKDGQYPIVTSGPNKGKRWSPQTPGPTNPAMKESTKAKKDYDGDGEVESGKDEYLGSKIAAAKKAGKLKESKKCNECGMVLEKCKCEVSESAKPDFLDMDKDGNKKEPMKSALKQKKVKESTGGYSAKDAAAGKDLGKSGKNFSKIAAKSGGGEKGKKIAGAVLAKLRAKG